MKISHIQKSLEYQALCLGKFKSRFAYDAKFRGSNALILTKKYI